MTTPPAVMAAFDGSDNEIDDVISEILAETQWHEEKLTVHEFMTSFSSAQPIRVIAKGGNVDLAPADPLHPFLAFSRRRRTKVYAENLVWDDTEKRHIRKGPLLEIPKDYLGWFEVDQKSWKTNHSCHYNIGDVASTKCKQFLVRTMVMCHLSNDNNNDGEFQVGPETKIYPGEILNVIDVITKKWKTQSVGGDKKAKGELSTKFLNCLDRQQRSVYIPFAHPGEFYPLWDSENKSKVPKPDFAYYIYDLLSYGFPLTVRVVFGWPPADFPEFSGHLRLLGVSRPDTLVLRNLKHGHCVVMELPIDCDVRLEPMANTDILSASKTFEKLLAHSCDRIYPYLIGMKHMDSRYPVLPPPVSADTTTTDENDAESRDSSNSVSSDKSRDTCRMARPREMKFFDTTDIFPPLEESIPQVADSWTLSFKDPDYAAKDLRDAESVLMDPESHNVMNNGLKGIKINEPPIPRREQMFQRRAKVEHDFSEREAEC